MVWIWNFRVLKQNLKFLGGGIPFSGRIEEEFYVEISSEKEMTL